MYSMSFSGSYGSRESRTRIRDPRAISSGNLLSPHNTVVSRHCESKLSLPRIRSSFKDAADISCVSSIRFCHSPATNAGFLYSFRGFSFRGCKQGLQLGSFPQVIQIFPEHDGTVFLACIKRVQDFRGLEHTQGFGGGWP